MSKPIIFDRYGSISDRRRQFVEEFLPELIRTLDLRTALDVGCGTGFFAGCLKDLGLISTGIDARPEHVAEARARYPDVTFRVLDVEDPQLSTLGAWDIVLSFGLLYHLENPFRAIRNLHGLTKTLLVIESMVAPQTSPLAALIREPQETDQSLNYIALVPSETCLVSMLYRAGFAAVYKPARLPAHDHFVASWRFRRRRTVLLACRQDLSSPKLLKVSERTPHDLWEKPWARYCSRALHFLRKPLKEKLATLRDLPSRW